MRKEALFLDRDGVINHLVRYRYGWDSPQRPADVVLVGGITELVTWANQLRLPVIEISNQPSLAKGKMDRIESAAIETRIHFCLKGEGGRIDKSYICLHHPESVYAEFRVECDCRKPKPGLLFKAADELGIDLSKSVFLGDKRSDIKAGWAAGCTTILYLHVEDEGEKVWDAWSTPADYKITMLSNAIPILKSIFR
jgi:D,D-heptose 1,7-bisphosphate phosphatase